MPIGVQLVIYDHSGKVKSRGQKMAARSVTMRAASHPQLRRLFGNSNP